MNQSYFRDQFDYLKQGWNVKEGTTLNPQGMKQSIFEGGMDALWDKGLGPAIGMAANLALHAGAGAGGYAIGSHFGGPVGGAVGGLAGVMMMNGIFSIPRSFAKHQGGFKGGMNNLKNKLVNPGGAAMASKMTSKWNLVDLLLAPIQRGMQGIGGLAGVGFQVGKVAMGAAQMTEGVARSVLTTGGRRFIDGKSSALDAWFPNFRNTPLFSTQGEGESSNLSAFRAGRAGGMSVEKAAEGALDKTFNVKKFAPNPRIIRRAVGISALFALGAGFQEAMSPQIAPPTLFFDGQNMRHINDMGANGSYGRGILGKNSALNMTNQDAARILGHLF